MLYVLTLVHVASQAAGSFSKKFLFDLYVAPLVDRRVQGRVRPISCKSIRLDCRIGAPFIEPMPGKLMGDIREVYMMTNAKLQ